MRHTVLARHNTMAELWLRNAVCDGIAATREPHAQQLTQRSHSMAFPALPVRPLTAPSAGESTPAYAPFATPTNPCHTPALAMPSTLHGTQAPHAPVPTATAVPSTAAAMDATTYSAAAATAASAPAAAAATAEPVVAVPPAPPSPAPSGAAAAAHSDRHDAAPARLPT